MSAERFEAFGSRRIEDAAQAAVDAALRTDSITMLVFRNVAVEIAPGDDVDEVIAAHDRTLEAILERETVHPLLSDVSPIKGDVIETLDDDHFTNVRARTIGLVCATTGTDGVKAGAIGVRFAARRVDYEAADFVRLRHVRQPER